MGKQDTVTCRRAPTTIVLIRKACAFQEWSRFRRFGIRRVTGERVAAILELRLTLTFQKRTGHAACEVDGTTLRQIGGL
jgi:hypothetical protein